MFVIISDKLANCKDVLTIRSFTYLVRFIFGGSLLLFSSALVAVEGSTARNIHINSTFAPRLRVTGAVQTPKSRRCIDGMTVLDLVLEAGGLTLSADPSRASLFGSDGSRAPVRLDHILSRGDMATNYSLRCGDTLTVPMIVDETNKPSRKLRAPARF